LHNKNITSLKILNSNKKSKIKSFDFSKSKSNSIKYLKNIQVVGNFWRENKKSR
jgi:hypothetical protein